MNSIELVTRHNARSFLYRICEEGCGSVGTNFLSAADRAIVEELKRQGMAREEKRMVSLIDDYGAWVWAKGLPEPEDGMAGASPRARRKLARERQARKVVGDCK